jgi:putative heme-binding domain-containing protein
MMRGQAFGIVAAALALSGAVVAQRFVPVEVEAGSRLFQANCTGCHGPEGDGVPGVNFSKGQYRRVSSDDDLLRIIVRGIPGTPMPPSSFSEGQATTVVAYLRTMAASGGASPTTSTSGDVRRGKAIFDGKGQCATCHSLNGAGMRSGPNLTEIGTFRRAIELERSLIDPDAEIRPENRSVRIVTRDGATITGRLMNQDTFSVQLLDPNERLMSYEKANLREVTVLRNSPMPSYRDKLTPQELGDLVAYLATLKGKP